MHVHLTSVQGVGFTICMTRKRAGIYINDLILIAGVSKQFMKLLDKEYLSPKK